MFRSEKYDPLAQSVEHLTFNQGVRDSSSRWVTKKAWYCLQYHAFLIICHGIEAFKPQASYGYMH